MDPEPWVRAHFLDTYLSSFDFDPNLTETRVMLTNVVVIGNPRGGLCDVAHQYVTCRFCEKEPSALEKGFAEHVP